MSNDWKEVIEDGQISWWHETLGGVIKSGNKYISEMPFVKVIKLGPFETLDDAKEAVAEQETIHRAVEQAIEVVNEELTKKG